VRWLCPSATFAGSGQCVHSLVCILFCFAFFLTLVQTPSPRKVLWASGPSHTDPGSGGRHSWHLRGTAHCPVSSGRGASALAHSPARLPRSDSYIHTCACPVGRGWGKMKEGLFQDSGTQVPRRHPSSTGGAQKTQRMHLSVQWE
jgi:hypothetical protein